MAATNQRVKVRVCKDCAPGTRPRPAPHPGPRCATHHRENKKTGKTTRWETRLVQVYGITAAEYAAIKEAQGGGCVCAEWTGYNGATRALSVDHDHRTGYVRGVLCKHCNDLLGRVRDDPQYFLRMHQYLQTPPARRVLGGDRVAPNAPRSNSMVD